MADFDMNGKVSAPAGKSKIGTKITGNGTPIGKPGNPIKTVENQPMTAKKDGAFGSGKGVIPGKV